jgi:hypothetical protein
MPGPAAPRHFVRSGIVRELDPALHQANQAVDLAGVEPQIVHQAVPRAVEDGLLRRRDPPGDIGAVDLVHRCDLVDRQAVENVQPQEGAVAGQDRYQVRFVVTFTSLASGFDRTCLHSGQFVACCGFVASPPADSSPATMAAEDLVTQLAALQVELVAIKAESMAKVVSLEHRQGQRLLFDEYRYR